MKLTIETRQAIETLETNLDMHREEYALQLAGWQREMTEYGKMLANWAALAETDEYRPAMPKKPVKFDGEYKRLILMMNVHQETVIDIDEDEFDEIFMDRFGWKRTFMSNSVQYGVRTSGEVDEGF